MVRDHGDKIDAVAVRAASDHITALLKQMGPDISLDSLRGMEGDAARVYFSVFDYLIVNKSSGLSFDGRNRRPPLDPVNCLLSFIYTLLLHDVRSALESVGLDSAVGYLHRDRPGRPGLALDMMEEFRPVIADRLVLSLVNRGQVTEKNFVTQETGAVIMKDDLRKTVLTTYQKRKQNEVFHPFLEEKVTVGLLFSIQALLMARYLRGDLDAYPPYVWR
jgi:CRISPR-associated protein Cas1